MSGLLLIAGGAGYSLRKSTLEDAAADPMGAVAADAGTDSSTGGSPLGDLTTFRVITQDSLNMLTTGDQSGATARIGDLEYEWDAAQSRLKSKDTAAWTELDGQIDTVLRVLRAANPNASSEQAALTTLLAALG